MKNRVKLYRRALIFRTWFLSHTLEIVFLFFIVVIACIKVVSFYQEHHDPDPSRSFSYRHYEFPAK